MVSARRVQAGRCSAGEQIRGGIGEGRAALDMIRSRASNQDCAVGRRSIHVRGRKSKADKVGHTRPSWVWQPVPKGTDTVCGQDREVLCDLR